MPTRRVVISLEDEEGKLVEVPMRMPTAIAVKCNEFPLFRIALEEMFQAVGCEVINVEIVEEVRHEFKRRWDDPKDC
jgi:hypothetical protein